MAGCLGLLCHMVSVLHLLWYLHVITGTPISGEANVNIKNDKMIIQSSVQKKCVLKKIFPKGKKLHQYG